MRCGVLCLGPFLVPRQRAREPTPPCRTAATVLRPLYDPTLPSPPFLSLVTPQAQGAALLSRTAPKPTPAASGFLTRTPSPPCPSAHPFRLKALPRVTVYGPPPSAPRGRASLLSFNVERLHATDVSTLLDHAGVAVRSGHHCAQPLHRELGVNASARASAYIYNTEGEVDTFVEALEETIKFFDEVNG